MVENNKGLRVPSTQAEPSSFLNSVPVQMAKVLHEGNVHTTAAQWAH